MLDNDAELLTHKLYKIIAAHKKWMKGTPWTEQAGDGRVVIDGVGIIEWEIDEEEREREINLLGDWPDEAA